MGDRQRRKSLLFGKKKLKDVTISSPHEGTFKHGVHAETSEDLFKVLLLLSLTHRDDLVVVVVCNNDEEDTN